MYDSTIIQSVRNPGYFGPRLVSLLGFDILNSTNLSMSLLFHKNTKKVAKYLWGALAILIIISMVAFAAPGLWTSF